MTMRNYLSAILIPTSEERMHVVSWAPTPHLEETGIVETVVLLKGKFVGEGGGSVPIED